MPEEGLPTHNQAAIPNATTNQHSQPTWNNPDGRTPSVAMPLPSIGAPEQLPRSVSAPMYLDSSRPSGPGAMDGGGPWLPAPFLNVPDGTGFRSGRRRTRRDSTSSSSSSSSSEHHLDEGHHAGRQVKKKSKRKVFGLTKGGNVPAPDPYDYLVKYNEDEYGKEMDVNARVWHVYLDEATRLDSEIVERWRENLDVLLVFAGLFSAVVTTFVVDTASRLEPDYAELTARLLATSNIVQQSATVDSIIGDIPSSPEDSGFSPETLDRWINGLWLFSLVTSLATALFSVLCKQWLQHAVKTIPGDPRKRARIMQYRRDSLKTWRMGAIIGLLPVLLHISLFAFFGGLAIYAFGLDKVIGIAIAVAVGLTFTLYFTTTLLPLWWMHCPYVTPLTTVAYTCLHPRKLQYYFSWVNALLRLRSLPEQKPKYRTLAMRANQDVESHAEEADTSALLWLHSISALNPSILPIATQAMAGLDTNFSYRDKLKPLAQGLPSPPKPDGPETPFIYDLEKCVEGTEKPSAERYIRASQCLYPDEWVGYLRSSTHSNSHEVSDLVLSYNPQLGDIWPTRANTSKNLDTLYSFMHEQMEGRSTSGLRPVEWQELLFKAGSLVKRFPSTKSNIWCRETTVFLARRHPQMLKLGGITKFNYAPPESNRLMKLQDVPGDLMLYFAFCFIEDCVSYSSHLRAIEHFFSKEEKPSFLLRLLTEVVKNIPATSDASRTPDPDAVLILQQLQLVLQYLSSGSSYFKSRRTKENSKSVQDQRLKRCLESLDHLDGYLRTVISSPEGDYRVHSLEYYQAHLLTLQDLYRLYATLSEAELGTERIPLSKTQVDVPLLQNLVQPHMLEAASKDVSCNVLEVWLRSRREDVLRRFVSQESGIWASLVNHYSKYPQTRPAVHSVLCAFVSISLEVYSQLQIDNPILSSQDILPQLCDIIIDRKISTGDNWPPEFAQLITETKSAYRPLWITAIQVLIRAAHEANPPIKLRHTNVEDLKQLLGLEEHTELIQWYRFPEREITKLPKAIHSQCVREGVPSEGESQMRVKFPDVERHLSNFMELNPGSMIAQGEGDRDAHLEGQTPMVDDEPQTARSPRNSWFARPWLFRPRSNDPQSPA